MRHFHTMRFLFPFLAGTQLATSLMAVDSTPSYSMAPSTTPIVPQGDSSVPSGSYGQSQPVPSKVEGSGNMSPPNQVYSTQPSDVNDNKCSCAPTDNGTGDSDIAPQGDNSGPMNSFVVGESDEGLGSMPILAMPSPKMFHRNLYYPRGHTLIARAPAEDRERDGRGDRSDIDRHGRGDRDFDRFDGGRSRDFDRFDGERSRWGRDNDRFRRQFDFGRFDRFDSLHRFGPWRPGRWYLDRYYDFDTYYFDIYGRPIIRRPFAFFPREASEQQALPQAEGLENPNLPAEFTAMPSLPTPTAASASLSLEATTALGTLPPINSLSTSTGSCVLSTIDGNIFSCVPLSTACSTNGLNGPLGTITGIPDSSVVPLCTSLVSVTSTVLSTSCITETSVISSTLISTAVENVTSYQTSNVYATESVWMTVPIFSTANVIESVFSTLMATQLMTETAMVTDTLCLATQISPLGSSAVLPESTMSQPSYLSMPMATPVAPMGENNAPAY